MSEDEIPENSLPWWVKVLIVLCALPAIAFPWMLSDAPEDGNVELWLWMYPVYVILSCVCEWKAWGRRPEVTWILMAVMLLTHGAMWTLVTNAQTLGI